MGAISNLTGPRADLVSSAPGAIRTARVSTGTGTVALGNTVSVTVTWDTPFSDTNYTALVTVEESTDDGFTDNLFLRKIVSRAPESMVVSVGLVANSTPLVDRVGTLHCIAIHD